MVFPTSAVKLAAQLFSQPISVDDYSSVLTGGIYVDTLVGSRTISGVIQPYTELDIKIETDGAQSSGYLLMHTADTVYAYDNTETTESNLQTYVRYEGNVWKVNQREDWKDKTSGYNRYILTKHVNPDSTVT